MANEIKPMELVFTIQEKQDHDHFDQAIQIFLKAFPNNEQQPLPVVKQRLQAGKSKLYIGLHQDDVVCMALLWLFENSTFILLDYMAVSEKYRSQKVGGRFFHFLASWASEQKKYLLMEVENPAFGDNREERKRRVSFYLNHNALILKDTPYVLPSLDNTTNTQMLLMVAGVPGDQTFTGDQVKTLIKRLYTELYAKKENDELLVSFIDKVPGSVMVAKEL